MRSRDGRPRDALRPSGVSIRPGATTLARTSRRGAFERDVAAQTEEAGLRCVVGGQPAPGLQARDRTDEHDRPTRVQHGDAPHARRGSDCAGSPFNVVSQSSADVPREAAAAPDADVADDDRRGPHHQDPRLSVRDDRRARVLGRARRRRRRGSSPPSSVDQSPPSHARRLRRGRRRRPPRPRARTARRSARPLPTGASGSSSARLGAGADDEHASCLRASLLAWRVTVLQHRMVLNDAARTRRRRSAPGTSSLVVAVQRPFDAPPDAPRAHALGDRRPSRSLTRTQAVRIVAAGSGVAERVARLEDQLQRIERRIADLRLRDRSRATAPRARRARCPGGSRDAARPAASPCAGARAALRRLRRPDGCGSGRPRRRPGVR